MHVNAFFNNIANTQESLPSQIETITKNFKEDIDKLLLAESLSFSDQISPLFYRISSGSTSKENIDYKLELKKVKQIALSQQKKVLEAHKLELNTLHETMAKCYKEMAIYKDSLPKKHNVTMKIIEENKQLKEVIENMKVTSSL
jgi:hypothetical protein